MFSLAFAAACISGDLPAAADDSLASLYNRGRTFTEFLAAAERRRDTWVRNAAWGKVEAEQLARARQLTQSWRILVVAEDWCGDSANTIPYLATFADSTGGKLELRIVNSTDGKWVMEGHRTHDGRAATPTVIILAADGSEAGCWVERPSEIATWMRENQGKVNDLMDRKYAWYDEDRGKSTVREILDLIEHAGANQGCGGNGVSSSKPGGQ
jgi:hypothetical protein